MKPRTLLTLGLLGLSSLSFAQASSETPRALTVQGFPAVPRAALAAVAPRPAAPPALLPVPFVPLPAMAPEPPEALSAQPPTPPVAPKAAAVVAPASAPAPPAPPRAPSQMVNVQIEVTLSDTKGQAKTVVLTVADGELGQNRTVSYVGEARNTSFTFNADARPTITGNKIRLYLSAEATVPPSADGKAGAAQISLRQQQTLILNDGDSAEIARAADPVSDRAFSLSVKVKIQR